MKNLIICCLTALILIALCSASLLWWWTASPVRTCELRLAIPIPMEKLAAAKVDIKGFFKKFTGTASAVQGSWTGFRGANRDNISTDKVPLADSWPKDGPKVLWSLDVGDGYAGPAVMNGKVYLLDYDEKERADALRCLSLDDGQEIWKRWYKVKIKRNHGMSRTVPALTEKHILTIGPKCQVMCTSAETGDFIWGIDLPNEYKTQIPLWYTGQCPLIDGTEAVIATGGDALMIGVDLATGKVNWKTPNTNGWQMSHSSIMPMTILNKKMYVYCAAGAMTGVAADGDDKGKLLWSTTAWNHSVISPSPIKLDDSHILATAGYGAGSMILEVSESDGKYSIKPASKLPRTTFACEQHTPILYKDHLYTVMPGDAGALKKQAVCMSRSGEILWSSGKNRRFGLGPFLIADNKMLILSDDGKLTMIEASANGYKELAQHKPLDGHDAWGPMAVVGGRLILRDFNKMICLDLKK